MKRVVITGMGVISPIGNSIQTFWESLKTGSCGIDFIRAFNTDDLSVKVAAEVKDFNPADYGIEAPTARKADLFTLYAMAAARQAMDQSRPAVDPERLGVYIGSGIGGIHTFIAECKKYHDQGPNRVSPLFIPTMIANMASGNVAIATTCKVPAAHCYGLRHLHPRHWRRFLAIRHGYADAVITRCRAPSRRWP